MESFERVGGALDDAKKAHERALGQLTRGSGNLVGQVEKLKALGARTGKSLGVAHDGEPESEEGPKILPANDDAIRAIPAAE